MKNSNKNKKPIAVDFVEDSTSIEMKSEYDFSNAVSNPFAGKIKKQITIRITDSTIEYFKNLGEELGIPYQTLINMCLTDYAKNKRKPNISF